MLDIEILDFFNYKLVVEESKPPYIKLPNIEQKINYICKKFKIMEEAKISQKSPYVLELKAGKYAWCSCGLSSKQPFCDGSHKGTSFKPVVFDLNEDKKVALCGCKRTSNQPFCDGSHKQL